MEPMLCTTPYLSMKMKNTLLLVFALLAGIASAQNLSYSSTCAPRKGDCFVDYNGKVVFMFVPSEF